MDPRSALGVSRGSILPNWSVPSAKSVWGRGVNAAAVRKHPAVLHSDLTCSKHSPNESLVEMLPSWFASPVACRLLLSLKSRFDAINSQYGGSRLCRYGEFPTLGAAGKEVIKSSLAITKKKLGRGGHRPPHRHRLRSAPVNPNTTPQDESHRADSSARESNINHRVVPLCFCTANSCFSSSIGRGQHGPRIKGDKTKFWNRGARGRGVKKRIRCTTKLEPLRRVEAGTRLSRVREESSSSHYLGVTMPGDRSRLG